jgi:hypothetical protein
MKTNFLTISASITMAAATALLSGCNLTQTAGMPVDGTALHGRVMGGQQPVGSSTLALYAAGNSGYGSAFLYTSGTSLLGSHVVVSDPTGGFSISGDYTCPSGSTEVYLVATGGNPGGGPNANLAVMAALGPCGNLSSSTFINMNELTTVASVWALSPFMSGIANVGTSATNSTGITNAFATVNKLVNTSLGVLPGPSLPAGATIPAPKINTLADILAACINSTGGTHGDGSACGTLFANTAVGGVFPTDTITAAMNIAQNPNQNVGALFSLASAASPFQPTLATAPSDFALVVTHTGGGISSPSGIAVDSLGNVWTANSGDNSATKLSNLGAAISGADGFTAGSPSNPNAIAVDGSGNAWLTNGNNTVIKLNSAGSSGTVYSGTNFNVPVGIAIDTNGNAWVANSGNSSLAEITSGGSVSSFSGGSLNLPVGIAINPK